MIEIPVTPQLKYPFIHIPLPGLGTLSKRWQGTLLNRPILPHCNLKILVITRNLLRTLTRSLKTYKRQRELILLLHNNLHLRNL